MERAGACLTPFTWLLCRTPLDGGLFSVLSRPSSFADFIGALGQHTCFSIVVRCRFLPSVCCLIYGLECLQADDGECSEGDMGRGLKQERL